MSRPNDQLTLEEINEQIAQLRGQLDNQEHSTQSSVRNIEASTEEVASVARYAKKVGRTWQKMMSFFLWSFLIILLLIIFLGFLARA